MFYRLDLKSLGNVLQTNKSTSLRDFPLSNIKPFCLKSLSILMVDSMGFSPVDWFILHSVERWFITALTKA